MTTNSRLWTMTYTTDAGKEEESIYSRVLTIYIAETERTLDGADLFYWLCPETRKEGPSVGADIGGGILGWSNQIAQVGVLTV